MEAEIKKVNLILSRLPGFLTEDSLRLFCILAKHSQNRDDKLLEIGVFCGRSLAGLGWAFRGCEAIGVDPLFESFVDSPAFRDEAEYLMQVAGGLTPEARLRLFWSRIREIEVATSRPLNKNISIVRNTQDQYFAEHRGNDERFQLVHIDGEHNYSAVKNALDELPYLLLDRAWLVVDDFLNEGFPDISEAVYRHSSFRTRLWPVFFGFNKAVFYYGASGDSMLETLQDRIAADISLSGYAIRRLSDRSVMGYGIPQAVDPSRHSRVWQLFRGLLGK